MTGERGAAIAWWTLTGAVGGFGLAGLLTVGVVILPVAVAMTVVGVLVPRLRDESMAAVLAGLAVPALWIAWLNREGPGLVCSTSASGETCVEEWSPWPFLIAAVLLVAAAASLYVLLSRALRGPATPG